MTMSGTYQDTSGRADSYNEGAAHDSGLYDPNRHDNQIVAVFEDRAAAQRAADALVEAGIPQSAIQVLDRTAGDAAAGTTRAEDRNQDEGFWGAVKRLFAPEEDYHAYGHAIDRGHAMVMVTPTADMDRHRAIEVLERSDPIDFDAKLAEWRQSGYDYSGAARAGDRMPNQTLETPERPRAAVPTERMARGSAGTTGEDTTIEVVEERLRVGKREVAKGAVRVRSYVVERPVEEQVRLREEAVSVDRQHVDRPVTPGADAFKEHTIEVRATGEEPVVSKEARVVEEVGLHKQASERTETVRDSVRETKVDVDDDRQSGMGTGGNTTSATPGSATPGGSGLNSTRK
jgi:uncharacterized protein (TIGR02271 family)